MLRLHVEDWGKRYPQRLEMTRAFVRLFKDCEWDLLRWLRQRADREEMIFWTILSGALHQGISHAHLTRFLEALERVFPGMRLARLPAPRQAEIDQVVAMSLPLRSWSLAPYVPGIIWSVGALFRRQIAADVDSWLRLPLRTQWAALGSVYYMGKSNAVRWKALLILDRLRLPPPAGIAVLKDSSGDGGWPYAISQGFKRWWRWVGPGAELEANDEEKLRLYQLVFRMLDHNASVNAVQALSFFAEPVGDSFECLKILGTCRNCCLRQWCRSRRDIP